MASCCRGAYFSNSYSVMEILKLFPGAKKVRGLSKQTENGVYYDSFLGLTAVRMVGSCPNLDTEGNCSIYDERPRDCWELGIESINCALFRRFYEQGLKILSEELISSNTAR